jgi:hypothetical protein
VTGILDPVTASVTRAVCGVLVLLLSGTPTALLACTAWCLPGMSHGVALAAAMTASAPEVVADAAAVAASAHAHHHVAAPEAPVQRVPSSGGSSLWAPAAGAEGHGCCPDAPALTAATVTLASSRADDRSVTLATATGPAPFRQVRVTHAAPLRLTAAATRSRLQTPLVLRV